MARRQTPREKRLARWLAMIGEASTATATANPAGRQFGVFVQQGLRRALLGPIGSARDAMLVLANELRAAWRDRFAADDVARWWQGDVDARAKAAFAAIAIPAFQELAWFGMGYPAGPFDVSFAEAPSRPPVFAELGIDGPVVYELLFALDAVPPNQDQYYAVLHWR